MDGVLVWVDPIVDGHDRALLDAMLREVAAAGVWVSAHPDVILKLGTKDVLVTTRDMAWGSDCYLYATLDELEAALPARLAQGVRVLKQHRGNSGNGVWRIDLLQPAASPADAVVRLQHAQRGSRVETLRLGEVFRRFAGYFAGAGGMIDQAFQPRLADGMVRCYLVGERVAGFGHQYVTALLPPPEGTTATPAPSPRLYYGADKPEFQTLRRRLESGWVAEMQRMLGIDTASLPALWDADFLLGAKDAAGEDTYVLCENQRQLRPALPGRGAGAPGRGRGAPPRSVAGAALIKEAPEKYSSRAVLTLILATQDKTVHLDAITPALAAAAVVAALAWLLLLAIFAVATRPKQVEAAAPTMDLGPEAPALVDYLVNHCRSTTHAEAATLLDLAARHYLAIDDREDDDTVCRLGVTPPNDLNDYERMLFDHVAQQAAKGPVPTRALTTGTAAQSAAWHQRFERLVMQDARGRGLSMDRLSLGEWTIVRLAGLAAAALVVVIAAQANAIQFGIFGVALAGVGAHTVVMKLLGSQRLTDSGVAAASHWLGVRAYIGGGEGFHDLPAGSVVLWDRYMAYACALGLARAAMRSLPLGVEDEHTAWSHYGGGEWHSVKVSYPHNHLVWGRTPLGVVSMGLILTALGVAGVYGGIKIYALPTASDGAGITHWIHVVALAMGAGGIIAAAWGLYTMRLGFQDFGPRRDVDGEVVRCRCFRRGNDKGVDYFVAVDDGKQPRIRAWLVDSAQYGSVQEGCVIHASVSATQAHVYDLSVVTPAARDVYTPAPLAGAATAAAARHCRS